MTITVIIYPNDSKTIWTWSVTNFIATEIARGTAGSFTEAASQVAEWLGEDV